MTNAQAIYELGKIRKMFEADYKIELRLRGAHGSAPTRAEIHDLYDRRLTALAKAADALKRSKDP